MKRSAFLVFAGLMLAGFGAGLVEAGKWLRTFSLPGSPWQPILALVRRTTLADALIIVAGITIAGYAVIALAGTSRRGATFFLAALAALSGLIVCRAAVALCAPFSVAPIGSLLLFSSALAVSVGLLFHIAQPIRTRDARTSIRRALIVAVGWTAFILSLHLASEDFGTLTLGGFGIFAALSTPAALREFPVFLRDMLGGAIYGAFAGTAIAWIAYRRRRLAGLLWGAASGAWISAVLFAAHCVVGVEIMRSAYSERVACSASLILGPMAALAIAAGIALACRGFSRRIYGLAAITLLVTIFVGAAAYVREAHAGSDLYLAALKARPYRTRVYMHFHEGGGWSRTIQSHADDIRISLCDRLLREHPKSAYAAEALYLKARSQFDSWRFADAARTLERLRAAYPDSRGASTLLLAEAYLAEGRHKAVTGDFGRRDWVFEDWRCTNGAQIVGHAYEALGRPNAARGLYAYYISNLEQSRRGAWTTPALRYAESGVDRVMPSQPVTGRMGEVRGRVVADGVPLAGVHIALVQPHLDASSPDNSTQFVGAITIPLWFGIGASTGEDGKFVMKSVPCGDYEVVVGFDLARVPGGRVISQSIPELRVDEADTRLPDINFTSSIRLVAPLDGVKSDLTPELTWRPYPGAAHYSVSLIADPNVRSAEIGGAAAREGYTCWMRSRITGNSVKITSEGFYAAGNGTDESLRRGLVPNRSYMWVVFAYDKDNRLISSSEHYRLDREPIFIAGTSQSKGG